jgi:hypothetical protein
MRGARGRTSDKVAHKNSSGNKIESPRYLVSLLVVEAAQAEQEVALGRELLREGRPVPQVGHGHMLRRLAVVVLRVLLRAAARVVVVIVVVVEQIDAGDDVVQVAGVPVELRVLHDQRWGARRECVRSDASGDADWGCQRGQTPLTGVIDPARGANTGALGRWLLSPAAASVAAPRTLSSQKLRFNTSLASLHLSCFARPPVLNG